MCCCRCPKTIVLKKIISVGFNLEFRRWYQRFQKLVLMQALWVTPPHSLSHNRLCTVQHQSTGRYRKAVHYFRTPEVLKWLQFSPLTSRYMMEMHGGSSGDANTTNVPWCTKRNATATQEHAWLSVMTGLFFLPDPISFTHTCVCACLRTCVCLCVCVHICAEGGEGAYIPVASFKGYPSCSQSNQVLAIAIHSVANSQ